MTQGDRVMLDRIKAQLREAPELRAALLGEKVMRMRRAFAKRLPKVPPSDIPIDAIESGGLAAVLASGRPLVF